jgi:hypothetical protein
MRGHAYTPKQQQEDVHHEVALLRATLAAIQAELGQISPQVRTATTALDLCLLFHFVNCLFLYTLAGDSAARG